MTVPTSSSGQRAASRHNPSHRPMPGRGPNRDTHMSDNSTSKLRRRMLASIAAAPLALSMTFGSAMAQDLTEVTLRLDSFYYGAHVPMLYAIESGIYEEAGLDVEALKGRGSANTIQTVAAGSDDFGFADGGTLAKFVAQGLEAKLIVGILEVNPSVIVTFPDSGITSAADLEGKRGGFGVGSAPEVLFPAFVAATGIDDSSIDKVSTDLPTRDTLFLNGEVDFAFGYSIMQPILMAERCDCEISTIRYADNGVTAISNGIIVGNDYAEENPEIVAAFAQATVKAIEGAIENPDAAVDAFMAYATDTALSREAVAQMWDETILLLQTEATKGGPFGVTSAEDWATTIDTLVQFSDLPEGAVTPEDVATNEYLEAATQ